MKRRWLLLALSCVVLLVPAWLLTTARLVEPAGRTWVRLVAFTPYALVLYLVALLVLAVASLRTRGFWRGLVRALAVVALVGLLLHAGWASGPFLGGSAQAATTGRPLTVMTSNLRFGRADTARLVDLAVRRHVDLLVLQEVTPDALAGLERAGVAETFPHRAGTPAPGAAGTMVFSRSRIGDVHRLATQLGSYRLVVRLPHSRGGRLRLVAVHPRPPIGDVTGWRADQLAVREAARESTGPSIVAGDLNATMDHSSLRELVGRGYADAATQARSGWQPTWPSAGVVRHLGFGVPPLVAIDHVLVRDHLRAVRTDVVSLDGTDHRALVATVLR